MGMKNANRPSNGPEGTKSILMNHFHSLAELYQTHHQFTNSQVEPLLRQIARGQMKCVRQLSLITKNLTQNKRLTYREKWKLIADEKMPSERPDTTQGQPGNL